MKYTDLRIGGKAEKSEFDQALESYSLESMWLGGLKMMSRICRGGMVKYLRAKRAFDDKYGRLNPARLP